METPKWLITWACLLGTALSQPYTTSIHICSLDSSPYASSQAVFSFPHPPTPIHYLISFPTWHPPETNLVEEARWNGVHPPTPSTFASWSSWWQVVCFHAPRGLPARIRCHIFTCDHAHSRKRAMNSPRRRAMYVYLVLCQTLTDFFITVRPFFSPIFRWAVGVLTWCWAQEFIQKSTVYVPTLIPCKYHLFLSFRSSTSMSVVTMFTISPWASTMIRRPAQCLTGDLAPPASGG